jgi:hypothetical protein
MRHLLAATIMLALGVALGGAGVASADPNEDDVIAAYKRGDYEAALRG